nr:uncharacterized protein LOC109768291 [Aegilops tauschii subsp. strangulata]
MASYRLLVQLLSGTFDCCEFLHISHAENEGAGTLAKIGSSLQAIPSGVSLEHLHKRFIKLAPDSESIFIPDDPAVPLPNPDPGAAGPSSGAAISDRVPGAAEPGPGTADLGPGTADSNPGAAKPDPEATTLNPVTVVPDPGAAASGSGAAIPEPVLVAFVTMPILAFLEDVVLPMDETEAQQVQCRASAYRIINNKLVKRSATGVFQRCVEQEKGIEILLDMHQGKCGHHATSRSLVAKAFHHGFYWTTTLKDAESLVIKCEGCQRFSKRNHQPASALQTIPITWPFTVWGLDMVGPFQTARGSMMHLIVAVEKFTKWIKARPIKKLDGPTAIRFIKNIAVRYDVLLSIITDKGTKFAKGALTQYCSVSDIWLDLASIAHPQSSGQVKRANGLILSGIKPWLVEPLIRSPSS